MQDLISVIIPVHNSDKYLNECLDSIINQTYENLEIIVIDDSSTDKSKEIILNYANSDKRILYFYKEFKSAGKTRNFGIDVAKGKYISFIDSDDYIDVTMIEKLHAAIKKNDSFSGTLQLYMVIDGEIKHYSRTLEEQMLLKLPNVWSRLYNKSIIDKYNIRFSDAIIGEDLEFNCKLLLCNNHASYINEALNYYRIHSSSSFRKNNNNLAILKSLDGINDFATDKNNAFVEFVNIVNVFRTAKIIISLGDYDDLKKIFNYLIERFPNWKENCYISNNYYKELDSFHKLVNEKSNPMLNDIMKEVNLNEIFNNNSKL